MQHFIKSELDNYFNILTVFKVFLRLTMDLSTVSIKIPQIGIYPVYYNGNNQSFPPIFIGAILNPKNVAIFRDIFVNIIAF